MCLMQATLTITLSEADLARQVKRLAEKIVRQRPLTMLAYRADGHKITLGVMGDKLDIYVLTNTLASAFPQGRVRLELSEKDVIPSRQLGQIAPLSETF